jgi:hypothetical protein
MLVSQGQNAVNNSVTHGQNPVTSRASAPVTLRHSHYGHDFVPQCEAMTSRACDTYTIFAVADLGIFGERCEAECELNS